MTRSFKAVFQLRPGRSATFFPGTTVLTGGDSFAQRVKEKKLRTLQRRIKHWRATEGPGKEIFFAQIHKPGELCQSDFTHMDKPGVTIGGVPFDHMIYHLVLTYFNWEPGSICFSESFESLSHGLQNALWKLGGLPHRHRTDRLATAFNKETHPEEFTRRYQNLMGHYGLTPCKTNPYSPNENGGVEQRNYRFKNIKNQKRKDILEKETGL